MPINVPLSQLRLDLRAETGQSMNISQGIQAQQNQDYQIARQQQELYTAYEWPHLRCWVDIPVASGQSLYDYPPTMPFDLINRIYWAQNNTSNWKMLRFGIYAYDVRPMAQQYVGTPLRWGNFLTIDPTGDTPTNPIGQIMLLPIPNVDGTLRVAGLAPLPPLINDDDLCIIDSKAIVMFAAVEILATQKAEVAQLKLTKAQNYLKRIRAQQGADKRANYNMGGSRRDYASNPYGYYPGWIPGIDYIPG
jgi:hypothetical protein